ncbi:MAG: C25 family cysteine peptidase [bacterium]
MDKMKLYLFAAVLFAASFAWGAFTLVSEKDNTIIIKYFKEETDKASSVLLPPSCMYSVETDIDDKRAVIGDPFYFKDYYLLPVRPYPADYTLKIKYTPVKMPGKIFAPDSKTLKTMESMVLNGKKLKEFIKPRLKSKEKTSYEGTPLVRVRIDSTGMYRVFYDEILAMSGIDLSSYTPATIKLYNNGSEIPLYMNGTGDNVFGPGDYFEFYAERIDGGSVYYNRYELENTYILSAGGGSGIRYVIDNSGMMDDSMIDSEITSTLFTYHSEYDSSYLKIGGKSTIDTTDFWYMKYLLGGDIYNASIPLDNFDTLSSDVNIRVYFHGTTYLIMYNPDHILNFYYDSTLISTLSWDGLAPYIFEYESLSVTNKDTCSFYFEVLPNDSYPNDVALNWIEVDYRKNLFCEDSRINFTLEDEEGFGNFRYRVKNFPSSAVSIYRKDLKKIEAYQSIYDAGTNTYEIVFDDQLFSSNRDYAVYGLNSFLSCDTIERFMNENLSSSLNEGEYVIITNQKLKSAAAGFIDLLDDEHTVKLVGSQEIYDEFSFGKKSIKGIKDFLVTAYNNWNIPPSNVMILADGSYDNNNHLNSVPNDIPVAFYYDASGFGMVCSDNYFAAVSGDDPIEDISISRFPARNENDINTAIIKAQSYLDWKNGGIHNLRAIFAYDTTGPSDSLLDYLEAKYQSYKLASMLPEYMYPEFMANKYDQNGDFISQLSYGSSYLTILAHGAEQSIGSRLYIRLSDIYRIYNMERMPFVNVYSCITGFFDKPNIDSMSIGEAFVSSPYGGAIAYYGSSTASSMSLNHTLSESNFKQFTNNGVRNIGDIALYGELDFYLQQGYIGPYNDESLNANQIKNYGMLGINLVDIKIPDVSDKVCSLSSYSIDAGDTLKVVLADTQLDDGLMQSVAVDSENRAISRDYAALVLGTGENSLLMPDSLVAGGIRVLTMAVTEDSSVLYEAFPSVVIGGIKRYFVLPASPDTTESLKIITEIGENANIANITAMYKYPSDASYRTMSMVQDSSNSSRFYTISLPPIRAQSTDLYFSYYISYSDTLGASVYSTPKKSLLIPSIPDLQFSSDPYLMPDSLTPYLCIKVLNMGKRKVTGVPIDYYGYVDDILTAIGSDTVEIEPNETVESRIMISKNYYSENLLISLNPDSLNASESNYANNILNVTDFDQIYAYVGSSVTDSALNYKNLNVSLRTVTLNDTNLIVLTREIFTDTISSVEPLIFDEDEKPYLYSILTGDSAKMTVVRISLLDTFEGKGILEYNSDENLYCALNQKSLSGETTLNRFKKSFIAAGWSDSTAPVISINIENKEFTGGVVLLNTVDFGCAIEDNEAINLDKLVIISDNDTLLKSEYTVLNSKSDNSIPIKFSREYENGTSVINVEAEDIFGNKSSKVMSFIVSNQFKIIRVANFPNPVKGEFTKIVCDFSKVPETAVLKVYAPNGSLARLIQMEQLEQARFFCDLDVSGLANGTYFYTVSGTLDAETIKSSIQKMSVIK